MRLDMMHINYKDWNKIKDYAKENGIKTFAELEMYCRVWKIESLLDLRVRLIQDHIEIAFDNYRKGVSVIGND